MKTINLFFVLFIFVCISNKTVGAENIKFSISNRITKNHFSYVILKIQNKSNKNYYLPAINSNDSEKWRLLIAPKLSDFFFITPIYVGYNTWNTSEFYESLVDNNEFIGSWEKKKKSLSINDFILLKAGESKEIEIPMNLSVQISDFCVFRLGKYDYKRKIFAYVSYSKKDKSIIHEFLNEDILCKLNSLGYSLYEDEIRSNKICIVPNQYDVIQSKPYFVK